MARLTYALPVDAHRKFDPSLSQSDLGERFTEEERTLAIIEEVESELEAKVGKFREARDGDADAPDTWTVNKLEIPFSHDAYSAHPIEINLDHDNVLPLDSSQGDAIQIRRGHQEDYEDITDNETNWELSDPRNGIVTMHIRPRRNHQRVGIPTQSTSGQRYVRLTYRYGNLGGSSTSPGETTLTESMDDAETSTIGVTDATRLPSSGTMLLGDSEYVYISDVDKANDTVTVESRGLRRTTGSSHSAGDRLHYCPMHIRSAVAAKVAVELLAQDDKTDFLVETVDELERNEKIRQLEKEWEELMESSAEVAVSP